MPNHVLLIDNDLDTCKEVKYNLDCDNIDVYYCLTAQEGMKMLAEQVYELVILSASILMPFHNLVIHMDKHMVLLEGNRLELTWREFDTLVLFAKHPGQVFTFEQLYESLWADEYLDDRNSVKCHFKRLRKKMGGTDFIESVRDIGYRMKDTT